MIDPSNPAAESKFDLVDVVHEWLGQQGLRKIWGLEIMHWPTIFGEGDIRIANIFLRADEREQMVGSRWQGVPYFTIWPYRVVDKGTTGWTNRAEVSASVYDPEFFEKLRKMLDYRESSNTIICRCPQCEGVKQ